MSEKCPGKRRCHGCMQWCENCGDVDQVCDFPQCDIHKRKPEIIRDLKYARSEVARLEIELEDAQKQLRLIEIDVQHLSSSDRYMVPRSFIDHEFEPTENAYIVKCKKCGQHWWTATEMPEEILGMKPCHDVILEDVMKS